MRDKTPWLERRFDTGLPPEMFPNVLERLRGTPARVEDRIRHLEPQQLTARRGDSWSVLENVGHLLQTESLWAARLDDFQARRAELTPARFEAWRVGEAQYNRRAAMELCAAFRMARMRLVERLARVPAAVLEWQAHHPRLGQSMRLVDLMVFIAEHDDHHLVAITSLIAGATGR